MTKEVIKEPVTFHADRLQMSVDVKSLDSLPGTTHEVEDLGVVTFGHVLSSYHNNETAVKVIVSTVDY